MAKRPTLGQVFAAGFAVLGLLLGGLFYFVLESSRASILESSDRLRDEASRQISGQVTDFLGNARRALDSVEARIRRGVIDLGSSLSVESALFSTVISNGEFTEATLTWGRAEGYGADGSILIGPRGKGQVSVVRQGEKIATRMVEEKGQGFVAELRDRPPGGALLAARLAPVESGVRDPTLHPTFKTPANKSFEGKPLWSDLSWDEAGAAGAPGAEAPRTSGSGADGSAGDGAPRPPVGGMDGGAHRRVRVSLQKAVFGADGRFAGVVRIGLSAEKLDHIRELRLVPEDPKDPHRVFLCDASGRLITRLAPDDRIVEDDGDLRVESSRAPAEVRAALKVPALKDVSSDSPRLSGRLNVGGAEYLYTFRALSGTQDWIVGIVVPEAYYLGGLIRTRNRLILVSTVVLAIAVAAGLLLLGGIRSALRRIVGEAAAMNRFEFAPARVSSPFSDVRATLESLERAKTAMRAMGKYVPIDLVRRLYQERSEPRLGGELIEVTLMFTDIRGFTTLSEKLSPNQLAESLGRYLHTMVGVIQHEKQGTIDKFIGDAIMTVWNAPSAMPDHSALACDAALACREAIGALFASGEWKGVPPFETRFGLHRDTVMVGHFGAPNRMNFTAIGDGVNLASRLEGLNKQYGTWIIVSHSVRAAAGERFVFRRLDTVAVKGKNHGVDVYELVARAGGVGEAMQRAFREYERALAMYQRGEFREAAAILGPLAAGSAGAPSDAPSATLLARCEEYAAQPPEGWSGIYEAHEK